MQLDVSAPIRLGIIGGGQLGKMLSMDAKGLGLRVNILDPSHDCPVSSLADEHVVANFNDREGISRLAGMSDVITYEIELADADALEALEDKGYKVRHPSYVLRVVQDKLMQKHTISKHGIPTPRFYILNGNIQDIAGKIGYPFLIKVRKGGYDGRGNFLVKSIDDLNSSTFKEFMTRGKDIGFYAEEYIEFVKEVSVIVARSSNGRSVAYPVAENIHDNGILDTSIVPARIDKHIAEKAKRIAIDVINVLGGIGVFGVEMFLTKDGNVMVNEIAPRVHNTGHYSIEACNVSQFEQHIRAILDLPLVEPYLICEAAIMVNILGNDGIGKYAIDRVEELLSIDGLRLHVYGKRVNKGRRKLGHFTVVSNKSIYDAIEKAMYARSILKLINVD